MVAGRSTTPEIERLLDEDAVAALLDLSPRTLQDWRSRGGGPDYVRAGGAIRYAPSSLRAWIESRTRRSTSDPGPVRASA